MKKIVVLEKDTLGDLDFQLFNRFGEVVLYDRTNPQEVVDRIKDANIVFVNKVVLNESNLKEAKNLELICEVATGYNNIDINYAKANNIAVTNVAGYSTPTVAQHTFATLLSLYNKIGYYDDFVKSGKYSDSGLFTDLSKPFNDIEGKRWGIIGLGAIGRKVAHIADAFGAEVIYYSTSGRNNNDHYTRVGLEELLSTCDIISIHAPLNENTEGLINYNNLCKMKKNAVLINMGRGPIVVDEDLARAIDEEVIAGAALDVFTIEPVKKENPLLHVKNKENLILTPHIAWASVEARTRLLNEVVKNIESFYKGEIRNRIV
ncbi:putative 2-hydroxyacid dehydrogenase [Clostridium bornimense]|uniref:Putative 2-hydroxyacid dehydrogenase n=1 Tax=Clostridium bornimense TaxID=1216932 RepID=W6S040_9CLOT|nr:D-2-hydroxyacid dehydrogenase [Clostridium bornimense]CDM70093.1 putative 2-hydroxyacid dehydrogenase [Clostridium bornimense]